jgi:hypothetical protein
MKLTADLASGLGGIYPDHNRSMAVDAMVDVALAEAFSGGCPLCSSGPYEIGSDKLAHDQVAGLVAYCYHYMNSHSDCYDHNHSYSYKQVSDNRSCGHSCNHNLGRNRSRNSLAG